ncbi:virulence plasmid 28.1kDa A family protein [Burkholderia sp. MSHR3999]|uniref:Tc toxin subunit A-related protein n=1 Tax=Burkholderia sp. MSHR3999 TaxID=1542965 RepID=UPI0005ACC6F1|nr:neuraminidase-like domain-containing protein [Burkholderia sp. MSHR3999]KIP17065.1 virulence plasmid 28.1kDa A family protein [Burkholderia sp. MSHR3999]
MNKRAAQLSHPELQDLIANHPDFDLLTHDFFAENSALNSAATAAKHPAALERLRAYQRLYRLLPHETVGEDLASAEPIAEQLIDAGFTSAHSIASRAPHRFVRETREIFGDNEELPREIHRRATQVRAAARHLFANVRDIAGSPLFAKVLPTLAEPQLVEYFQRLPSYQSLFGSLDYIRVPETASIFSPAAYFLDIMRIVDEFITDYNRETIPAGYLLEDRRPDLFSGIKLSAKETTKLVPYVSLVLDIFVAKLTKDLKRDPYPVVATAPYPFNLPFSRPLAEIGAGLAKLDTSLAVAGKLMLAENPLAPGYARPALACAALALSPEQGGELITVNATDATIGAQYGVASAAATLIAEGDGTITYVKDGKTASGANGKLGDLLKVGQRLASEGQVRVVTERIDAASVRVDPPWVAAGTNVKWQLYGFPLDLVDAQSFRHRTGGMDYEALVDLFTQQLSHAERAQGAAANLFINQTGESLQPLAVVPGDTAKGNVNADIAGLSAKRLDRLSRFIRLARLTALTPTTLNWLMTIAGQAEITEELLRFIAGVKQLAELTTWPVERAAALVGRFRTSGRGDGPTPADPFDVAFNPPALLGGRDPYTAPDPLPFDPARPLVWVPDGVSGDGIEGAVSSATASTVVLSQQASAVDGAYAGLEVGIVSGVGSGTSRIIKEYVGATRTATLYTNWGTAPTAGSTYRIANAAGLADRLAAALQVKQADLQQLGNAYREANASASPALTLDLDTLTGLWRLASIAQQFRLPIAEYLLARSLAGLSNRYQPNANDALAEAQTALATMQWLEAAGLSAYELAYIQTGLRSRFVRLAFDPANVPAILADLASSSIGTRVFAQTLVQAGFPSDDAARLLDGLRTLRIVDSQGLIVPHDAAFNPAAAQFPVNPAELTAQAGLTDNEATAAVATLCALTPPPLKLLSGANYVLTADYPLPGALDALLQRVPDAQGKRIAVGQYLDATLASANRQMLAPLFPIDGAAAFVSGDIGVAQSRAVFDALKKSAPPVILPAAAGNAGVLSARYDGSTTGWTLFQSGATGQSGAIASYDPATRTATVSAKWAKTPDVFTYYRVVRPLQQGAARSSEADRLTLAADASPETGAYVGYTLVLGGSGAQAGEARTIVAYDGESRTAMVSPAWTVAPAADAAYAVGTVLVAGNADGGTDTTIVLGARGSDEATAYAGCGIYLVADPDAAGKTAQVRGTLDILRERIVLLAQTLSGSAQAQQAAALGGIAGVLAVAGDAVVAGLPYASSAFPLPRYLVPAFLGGDTAPNRASATTVLEGLSRLGLLQSKIAFGNEVWTAIARQPALFSVGAPHALTHADLLLLSAFKTWTRVIGDDGLGVAGYLALWPSVIDLPRRLDVLHEVTGWAPRQVSALAGFLGRRITTFAGIGKLAGLLRLAPVFAWLGKTASDADFAITLANVVDARALGPVGGQVDETLWRALDDAAAATLAAVAVRYQDQDFAVVSDQLRRTTDTAKRDTLLDFLLWRLNKAVPALQNPSDLFSFLLIDVEMSGIDTTTPIAQAIPSVQLYMQRCRMALEPGVTVDHIEPRWWEWMTTYRLWEVNRKIFLYPENYLIASQRSSASPEFKEMQEQLLQSRPTDTAVAKAMVQYFNAFEVLAGLVPVGGYKAKQTELAGGQVDETALLIGRTNVSPYEYYLRTFTRSTIPEARGISGLDPLVTQWKPWQKVGASIDAQYVTPVWAFDRPFLFWNEVKPTKSSVIDASSSSGGINAASNTQSTWQTTLKYTFPTSTGDWLSAQQLMEPTPIRIAPNAQYAPANNPNVVAAFANIQHYWSQPFALMIPRGLPGTGTLSFATGASQATGKRTRLQKQVQPGDFISVGGQQLQVHSVDPAAQTLVTKTPFRVSGTESPFNVIPKDPQQLRYAPYVGEGVVKIGAGFNIVDGVGTAFTIDFAPGDFIQIGSETRVVGAVFDDTQLIVNGKWTISTESQGDGTVTVFRNLTSVSGTGTRFTKQAHPGEDLIFVGQKRKILEIESDTELLISTPFDVAGTTTDKYKIGVPGEYTVLPRADGNERLLVFYGPNLNVATDYGGVPPEPNRDNPGDDPFISARIKYNDNLYSSLNLLQAIKNDGTVPTTGDVTGQKSLLLNGALVSQEIRLFNPTYAPTIESTAPLTRLGVDRANNVLYSSLTDRVMVSLYWGNSTPATTENQASAVAADRALLHHTNNASSVLLGVGNQIGWYLFNNNSDYFLVTQENDAPVPVASSTVLRTFWQPAASGDLLMDSGPYSARTANFYMMKYRLTRLSTSVAQPLKQRLFVSVDALLSIDSQYLPESPVNQYYPTPDGPPPAALDAANLPPATMDFRGPNGLYFWEIFYHAPMLVAEWLTGNQDYANAKRWFEHVFNPTATGDGGEPAGTSRYWQFRPFRDDMTVPALKQILTNTIEINLSNDEPFDPDAIARLRISAYAKVAVLKYVDNAIKWADALFTQDTRESIAQATNLYAMARDLLGETPQVVGVFEQREKLTFNEIKEKYPDGIPQYLIDLENTPFVPATGQGNRFFNVPVNDIHAYFGVPDNEDLRVYWDTIDDRLFKIRNGMNINGVARQLALFAPPIDPHAVIAAFGGTGSLAGGATGLPYPIPNYRFAYLIQTAKTLADQVARFGAGLLAALERQDTEALSQLGIVQQAALLQLTTQVKEQTIVQVDDQAQSLQQALNAANARKTHYDGLIRDGMIAEEIAEMTLMATAAVTTSVSSVLGAAASVAAAFPQVGSPFALTFGGQQLGPSLQNASGWTAALAKVMETSASILAIVAAYKRQEDEWGLQQQLAGFDAAQFQAQLAANAVQKTIAQRDLQIHLTSIEQNRALQDFYKDKFTNRALYGWLASRLAASHFQAYSLALEFARMAQRAYQFENRTNEAFIAASYWDDARKGLLAGETLGQALSQLEAADVRGNSRSQEITKMVSLRQLDPAALLRLIRTGETEFALSERLFDQDFPGQYLRRIQSVRVTIPALVGPYQNIHATLTQTANRLVLEPNLNAVKFLLGEDIEVKQGLIEHNVRPFQSISLSQGQGDSGVFDPNPAAPLYLPFEQTGAISSWRLTLPKSTNLLDFGGLADVVLDIRYTARDGGDAFRAQVASLPQLRERSWAQLYQPALQFQSDWSRFVDGPLAGNRQSLRIAPEKIVPPNLEKAEVLGVLLQLVVPNDTPLGSQHPYVTVTVEGAAPVTVLPSPDGTAVAMLERPLRIKNPALPLTISFDLEKGYTPSSLRIEDGKRLDPKVLQDVNVVLFLSARA